MGIRYQPAEKVPPATQRMWEVALSDMERADGLLDAARKDDTATPEYIAMRERDARTRRNICKAINFLITNSADVNAVIEAKKKRTSNN